jgi:hypothetical protein
MHKGLASYILILLLSTEFISSQEIVTGLQINPLLSSKAENKSFQAKGITADTLELPFFDDFSQDSYIPDPEKWSDNFAFINNTYSDKQITVGMATLDALDESGKLYEIASPEGFIADHFTSQPLNIDYPVSDNIWLSFYYQPGGKGDVPEPADSLVLQFYAPLEEEWYSVWKSSDTSTIRFKPVIIRLDNSIFLKRGFRFRFVNYASLSGFDDLSMVGNCDQWNIDYVYLDRNRNSADTALADVAFRTPLRSILKTYESMPWQHFKQAYLQEMGSFVPIHYRNNDIIVRNVTRNFVIRDMYTGSVSHSFSAGATNIDPLTNVDYNANLIYTFNNSNTDSALFRITSYLITDDFDPKANDTIKYYQVFSNYFSYDDGTSEGGYGINGQGSRNAAVAYRFKSYYTDTLRAVSICFNDSYLNSNQRAFDLAIWDDNNGMPGNVIYTAENMIVEPGEGVNGFLSYVLPDLVIVNGVFYIGWKQRTETFLNAGFDVNTPHKGRQFYWLNGAWHESLKDGSIMIRPIVGPALKITSSDDETISPEISNSLKLWPNPASDYINIDCGDLYLTKPLYVSIIDLQGKEFIKVPYNKLIDISSLKSGIYTVIVASDGRRIKYIRLVITK